MSKATQRQWYLAHRAETIERARLRAVANPERNREDHRRWADAHPEKRRNQKLHQRYGISLADYEHYLAEQNGVCAICHEPPPLGRVLHVDHDHDSPSEWVRGLLCGRCNTLVENIEHLRPSNVRRAVRVDNPLRTLAAEYIKQHTEARSWEL